MFIKALNFSLELSGLCKHTVSRRERLLLVKLLMLARVRIRILNSAGYHVLKAILVLV